MHKIYSFKSNFVQLLIKLLKTKVEF